MATRDPRSSSPDPSNPLLQRRERHHSSSEGLFRRSWHAMTEMLSPFSSSALSKLPDTSQRNRDRETRADRIPDSQDSNGTNTVVMHRDYNTITPVPIRVPKKISTTIKVEGKVWFANERSTWPSCPCSSSHGVAKLLANFPAWVAYVNVSVLIGTLAMALFNASKDPIARNFAFVYAVISVGVLVRFWFSSVGASKSWVVIALSFRFMAG